MDTQTGQVLAVSVVDMSKVENAEALYAPSDIDPPPVEEAPVVEQRKPITVGVTPWYLAQPAGKHLAEPSRPAVVPPPDPGWNAPRPSYTNRNVPSRMSPRP